MQPAKMQTFLDSKSLEDFSPVVFQFFDTLGDVIKSSMSAFLVGDIAPLPRVPAPTKSTCEVRVHKRSTILNLGS